METENIYQQRKCTPEERAELERVSLGLTNVQRVMPLSPRESKALNILKAMIESDNNFVEPSHETQINRVANL